MSFVGKVALVTGGAQGIGLGIVRALAEAGASVVFVDINKEQGIAQERNLVAAGLSVHFWLIDVSKEADVESMFGEYGFVRLDIVVNNARSHDESYNQAEEYFRVARASIPLLSESSGGSIVNISSALARTVTLHEPCSYHVSKANIEQFTRYLALELGPNNIRVNAVAPGVVDRDSSPKLSDNPTNKAIIDQIPLGRAASAKDIADAVVFLCSPESSYITGQILTVDGGLSICEPFGFARRSQTKEVVV